MGYFNLYFTLLMRISFAIFALINNVSSEVGVWDDTAYCVPGTELATIENTMFSLEDCAEYCVTQYEASEGYNGNACCDYEGWQSGLSDCTLYGDTDETVPYTNMGAYGNTDYNFYASMTYTADAGVTVEDYPIDLPNPGTECVNDDSTGDRTGDTCSMYYDNNYAACGNWDTGDFTAADQCCACNGGVDYSTGIVEDAVADLCVNDDSVADSF